MRRLAGGGVLGEDLGGDFFEKGGVALRVVEAGEEAVVGEVAGVGAEDLVEAALGAFFGVGGFLLLGSSSAARRATRVGARWR